MLYNSINVHKLHTENRETISHRAFQSQIIPKDNFQQLQILSWQKTTGSTSYELAPKTTTIIAKGEKKQLLKLKSQVVIETKQFHEVTLGTLSYYRQCRFYTRLLYGSLHSNHLNIAVIRK